MDDLHDFRRLPACKATTMREWQSREKAMRPAQPVKIPPLGLTAESAPFDKGVNPAMRGLEPGDLG